MNNNSSYKGSVKFLYQEPSAEILSDKPHICDIIISWGLVKMAWCRNCGRELSDRDTVCGTCFTPVDRSNAATSAPKYNVFCIIGFSASVSYFLCFLIPPLFPLTFVLPVIGMFFSIVGVATCRNPYRKGRIFGILGIVISALEILLFVMVLDFFSGIYAGPRR